MTVQVGKDCVDREEAAMLRLLLVLQLQQSPFGLQKTAHIFKIFQNVQKDTETAIQGRTVSRMNNNTDELAKLRGRFIELKTTLEERIKENHESLIRIANLNYHIDRLLERSKRHFTTPAPKTNLFVVTTTVGN